MKKTVRLTESDLNRIVQKILSEQTVPPRPGMQQPRPGMQQRPGAQQPRPAGTNAPPIPGAPAPAPTQADIKNAPPALKQKFNTLVGQIQPLAQKIVNILNAGGEEEKKLLTLTVQNIANMKKA